jgi:hypothetical protein
LLFGDAGHIVLLHVVRIGPQSPSLIPIIKPWSACGGSLSPACSEGFRSADRRPTPSVILPCALMTGLKRSLEESSHDGDGPSPQDVAAAKPASPSASSVSNSSASSFRNVSACNRCRLRKNRCDQRLPSCASCDKAGVKCVGYDPITKREIPRRWVLVQRHGGRL